ncbi:hypothetical protein FDP08_12855 [Marinobacter panjinensis]|uniref:Uncharacterized protein n=1 Tax=Marinobacter panjinensis TaxID=2576384 RepID=A0A4U6R952_9GAMM|nr:hypothetical protein [Marinobacter panjinensis]MCR8914232.1 hypothetical protein [Marinobacter panjinensis]TKV68916.1 hypothetical protein FDP08_12855 [Marinobacter panjinensis]
MNEVTIAIIAYGAISAAVIAGFFSFLNLISSKENAVSDSRQKWINEFRAEISRLTAAIHELVRIEEHSKTLSEKEYIEVARETYKDARESLTNIQLRLNPEHVERRPQSMEAKLWNAISKSRTDFANGDLSATVVDCDKIREEAAPLLKKEWERVKRGELTFRVVKVTALVLLIVGIAFVVLGADQLIQIP